MRSRATYTAAAFCYSALHISRASAFAPTTSLPLRRLSLPGASTCPSTRSFLAPRPSARQSARAPAMSTAATAPAAVAPAAEDNPLVKPFKLPPFSSITPAHVEPGIRAVLDAFEAGVKKHEATLVDADPATHTWDSVVVPMYEIEDQLSAAWGAVSHLMGVKNSDELREAHAKMQPEVVKASTLLQQSRPLYDGACAIRDSAEWGKLSSAQQQVLKNMIRDAELAGVSLEGADKERFNAIQVELSGIATKFSNNVLDSTKAFNLDLTDPSDVEGLPKSLKELLATTAKSAGVDENATAEKGPWRVTLDFPSMSPFLMHCKKRELREKVYRAYVTRASGGDLDNSELVEKILKLRGEKASLLGFKTYADVSLASKMAESVEQVNELLTELLEKSYATGKKELAELQAFAKSKGAPEGDDLKHWDVSFWSERLREEQFAFSDEELKQYFPLPRVLNGLFGLIGRLFQVSVVEATEEVETWHEDVQYFKLLNKNGDEIASFFLDPYSRPAEKRGGAWMNDVVSKSACLRHPDGSQRKPIAFLICNGSPPVGGNPSLMTFREVETLFHECGHGLQHMLTDVEEQAVTGINGVEWDAVETASQFNEHWCYHKETLKGMTGNAAGEPLPDDLYEKIVKAKNFRSATAMLRQLNFAMTDMALHSTYNPEKDGSPFDLQRKIGEMTTVMPALPEDRFLCAFSHIFAGGYAAGYYSYKWAEVLASDCFAAFEEANLEDPVAIREVGEKYRSTILGMGGSKPAMDVFVDFRGRKPETAALLRHSGLAA